jgi:SAM-dependent methyltransferase
MKWKHKALVQRLIARLPEHMSLPAYYFLQRRFGGLGRVDHLYTLNQGRRILDRIVAQKRPIASRVFLEVGTGRALNIPITLWLCGAEEVITVDLNPYLQEAMVFELIGYIRCHGEEACQSLKPYADEPGFRARLHRLISSEGNLSRLLAMMNVRYLAPADAAALPLPSESIDYHVSSTVFEHVPPDALERILAEGKRLLRDGGLFVHGISLSDHFSHSDKSISSINFLQFTEDEWAHYAGNRFMYHNRLRIDDYLALFERVGIAIVSVASTLDERAAEELRKGFPLDGRFKNKSIEVNATNGASLVGALTPTPLGALAPPPPRLAR